MMTFSVPLHIFTQNKMGTWLFENVGRREQGWGFRVDESNGFPNKSVLDIHDDMLAMQFKLTFADHIKQV